MGALNTMTQYLPCDNYFEFLRDHNHLQKIFHLVFVMVQNLNLISHLVTIKSALNPLVS